MFKSTAILILGSAIAFAPPMGVVQRSAAIAALPLKSIPSAQLPPELGYDSQLWQLPSGQRGDYQTLLRSIDRSLNYLQTSAAVKAYRSYPVPGITRYRVIRSLKRFRQLVRLAKTPTDLANRVRQEFIFYESTGKDGAGTVEFTSYFEPTYRASRVPTTEYRYPLYKAPTNLSQWPQPHPTRAQLEGIDGRQGAKGPLRGLELVWLRDRLEAFLVQVQGSARLQLTDGSTMTVGYGGNTDYPYTSLGKELVKDGKFKLEELSLPVLIQHLQNNPQDLDQYLPRNNRFIFFRETYGAPATGSLGVPVAAERSIATDKSLMPPGALALIQTKLPYFNQAQTIEFLQVSRYVLDQDTGSAIKGPGRVDIFMGTGEIARERAGLVNFPGKLYYLLLKP